MGRICAALYIAEMETIFCRDKNYLVDYDLWKMICVSWKFFYSGDATKML